MDMRELKTFVVLAEVLNYQRAAEILDYAPSTLAHHIQVIEAEMGKQLLKKNGRQLILTGQGKEFLPYAHDMLTLYQNASEKISGKRVLSRLAMGGSEASMSYCFAELLSRFTEHCPSVRLKLFCGPNSATPALVAHDTAELGFFYSPTLYPIAGISDVTLFREMNCLICSAANPYAQRDHILYEDLAGARFAFPHDDCLSAVALLDNLNRRGVQPGKVSYPGSMSPVIELVQRENAIMCLPYSAAKRLVQQHHMAILRMDEEPAWVYARILFKNAAQLSAPARELLKASRQYAEECLQEESALYFRA